MFPYASISKNSKGRYAKFLDKADKTKKINIVIKTHTVRNIFSQSSNLVQNV